MPRSLDDLLARGDELADQFELYEPTAADEREPALLAIRRLAYQRALMERQLLESVREARQMGTAWSKIGHELGTSGEAARQRYADKVNDGANATTP